MNTVLKPSELVEVLEFAIKSKITMMIKGAPGIGKTHIVNQACKKTNNNMIHIDAAICSQTDLMGYPMYNQDTDTASFVPYGHLLEMITATEPTIVFLDDFGLATPSVQGSIMHLLSERRIGHRHISDNVTFILATNDQKQHAGVNMILEPVKSRCQTIVTLQPDLDDWTKWAFKNNVHPAVIGFVRLRPEMLWDFDPTNNLVNSPSPRTNVHVSNWMKSKLPENVLYAAIEGAAGSAYALEFAGYRKLAESIVSPDYVIENPEEVDIPTDRSVLFALTTALAYRANKENLSNIIKFARRISEYRDGKFMEIGVGFVEYNIMAMDEELKNTSEYIKWAVDFQEYLKN